MISDILFILTGTLIGALVTTLTRKDSGLRSQILQLEKEIEIKNSQLDYQKKQYTQSLDHFSSTELIIMEMMQEIEYALKAEEGDLLEKILKIIFEKAKDLLVPEKCILFRIDTDKNSFFRLYSLGYKEEQLGRLNLSLDPSSSFLGWSAATGRFLSLDDVEQDSLLSHLVTSDPLKCYYSQPLKVNNKVKAMLCLGALKQPKEKNEIMRLFSILSNIASVALSNASLTQELRELSIRDGLTGLYNHSYFQKWLEISLSHLNQEGDVFSIALIDLDFFKNVNDTYGHQAGDIILKTISRLLSQLKITNYIASRYGGEEFVLVLVGKDKAESFSIMEDLRSRIAKDTFEIQNDKRINVTISAGIAEARFYPDKKIIKSNLIEAADQALYKAKAAGRNKVIMAS